MNITLLIKHGPHTDRKTWLRPGFSLSVGRTEQCDLALEKDPTLSSKHFVVENNAPVCRIKDSQSTNGTFVNGERISEAELRHGDIIRAGRNEFLVSFDNGGAPPKEEDDDTIVDESTEPKPVRQGPLRQTVEIKEEWPEDSGDAPLPVNLPVNRSTTESSQGQALVIESPTEASDEEEFAELLAISNSSPFVVGTMPWEDADGKARLTVIIKATFSMESRPRPAENQLPLIEGDLPFDDADPALLRFESDFVPFKPRADVILVGHAHAPKQRPVTQLDTRLRVGSVSKTIRVFGDRSWSFPTVAQMVPRIIGPEPFTTMEISYGRAFGGIDEFAARFCAENLDGVGYIGDLTAKSVHKKPLPNFEDPNHLITGWNVRPKPQGFGYYGRGSMPRLALAGTFDEDYLKNRSPLPPEDASLAVNNGAHPDLQYDGYLNGGEEVELDNLSPRGNLHFRLPTLRPKISISRHQAESEPTANTVSKRPPLDTLVLVPDDDIFFIVYRSVFEIPSIDEIDIARIQVDFSDHSGMS